jgi:hypothetical protein
MLAAVRSPWTDFFCWREYLMKAGIILLLAALPVLAGTHAVAADLRFGKAEPIAPVGAATDSRAKPIHARVRSGDVASEERSPLAYSAFALIEAGPDEYFPQGNHTVHLYPVGGGDAPARAAAAAAQAPAAKEDGERARRVYKASLPEPGSWAMILAGLLGVGAIARRRMSA